MTMLPLARYRLYWRCTTPLHFPDYAGSMLRGAFGHALRRIACMTRQKDCSDCPLLETCPYPAIFAPPARQHRLQNFSQTPPPYLIEPPAWGEHSLAVGDEWHFSLVLCGRALKELPLITLAFRQALQRGLGVGDGQSELLKITLETEDNQEQTVYSPEDGRFTPHRPSCPAANAAEFATGDGITLHLLTPLRLQENGQALPPNRLNAQTLLMAVIRRTSLMAEFHGEGAPGWDFSELKQAAANVAEHKTLEWKDWTRRSARQQQTMKLGGVVGFWELSGNLTPFLPALYLGQWLHLGKETVFGLGHYRLEHKSAKALESRERPLQAVEIMGDNAIPFL